MIKKLLSVVLFFIPNLLFTNPSSLDTSFNQTGYATLLPEGASESINYGVAIQDDGKTVTCSRVIISGVGCGVITRYNTNGTLDTSFGYPNGYIILNPTSITLTSIQTYCEFDYVAIQDDGKILIAGYIQNPGSYFILRYNTDGTLDTTFNLTGYFASLFDSSLSDSISLTLQPDGKIVVAGSINKDQVLIARHNTDGSLDTSFNAPYGYILPSYPGTYKWYSNASTEIKLQSTGKIIFGLPSIVSPSTQSQIILLRLNTDGTLDTTFGPNETGSLTTSIGYETNINALTIVNDQIIIAGSSYPTASSSAQFIVARYTMNGTLDSSFNEIGYVSFPIPLWSSTISYSIAAQKNGIIITTGSTLINNISNLFAIYFNSDGSLDTRFNTSGYYTNNFESGVYIYSSALQNNDNLIFVGNNIGIESFIARYLNGTASEQSTSEITTYGYNSEFISDFLYQSFYATIITDTTAQTATLSAVNTIIDSYTSDYSLQSNFNFIAYLYLLKNDLNTTQATLIATYPNSTIEINKFFLYLNKRIAHLIAL